MHLDKLRYSTKDRTRKKVLMKDIYNELKIRQIKWFPYGKWLWLC